MKIKCVDTRQARSNLEASVKLGRQKRGLFGYIETVNNNGELYVRYRSGTGFHGVTDIRKIVFEENYIVLKDARPIVYFLVECIILFVIIAALFIVIGELIYSIIILHKINSDAWMILSSNWLIWALKAGPMFYVKSYVKSILESTQPTSNAYETSDL